MKTVFSTQGKGIGGKIKRRYSDFLVEELAEDHNCQVKFFLQDEPKDLERNWPEKTEGKDQLILEMEKFNLDQNNAVRFLTRFLQTSKKRVGFAGMKDKRAITSQRISIWQPDYEKVKAFRLRNIYLKPLRWDDKRIELGDLTGNRFTVTIREIELEKKELEKRIKSGFKEMEKGIANFFGEQRFGGIRKVSHLVGKSLLKENVEEAALTYLTATAPKEREEIKEARTNLAKTKDFSLASKEFPAEYRYERAMIHHLCKYPHDFAGAFRKLPKNILYLFVHAFQSYLFNKVIEKRLGEGLGLGKIEGDILMDGQPTAPLYGFKSKLAEGKAGEIEKAVLAEANISLSDFKIKSLPEASSKGLRKSLVLLPQKLKLVGIEEDDLNPGQLKAKISFELTKGNYATTVLRELMKTKEF